MKRKWYDFKDAAKYLGISTQDFYSIVKNREVEFKEYITRVPNKRMISIKGLKLLINIK